MKRSFLVMSFLLLTNYIFAQQYFSSSVNVDLFKFNNFSGARNYSDRMFSVLSYSTSIGYSKMNNADFIYDFDFSRGFIRSYYYPDTMLITLSYAYATFGLGYVLRSDKALKLVFCGSIAGMNYLAKYRKEYYVDYIAVGSFFTLTPQLKTTLIYELNNFDVFTSLKYIPIYNLSLSPLMYSYKGNIYSLQFGVRFRFCQKD